ncbi:MAG TPA: hypothetical protein PKC37_04335 [Kaistella sp.]|jgi:hypothetical protein|nr:hypothetical protein [Chryseobacterium sp.]HMU07113.1 hypothetical protein [Kaistella sp.]
MKSVISKILIISLAFNSFYFLNAQVKVDYNKVGAYKYQLQFMAFSKHPDAIAFEKNVRKISDFFITNSETMKNRKGFDLKMITYGARWNDRTAEWTIKPVRPYQFGLRGELVFLFQLFLTNGNQWTVEPPYMKLYINETETGGHAGLLNDGEANSELKKYFFVSTLRSEIAPGVHYYNSLTNTSGQIVVFNPKRAPYWLPVTVRELTQAKLNYYKNGSESDKAVYDFIKPIVDAMGEEELNAPAFYGSEDAILNVNGKGQGLQIMKFNPDYWDRTLPPSSIQYITIFYNEFGYNCADENCWKSKKAEFYRDNGHSEFWEEITKEIPLEKLGNLIDKK